MFLTIGKRAKVEVKDFAEASAVYSRLRDESGEGSSTFPEGKLPGHYVSYNGKVWAGKSSRDWAAGKTPVFNPYANT